MAKKVQCRWLPVDKKGEEVRKQVHEGGIKGSRGHLLVV
jgi:hypothetical protein